jgi:hypothetical protein
MNAINKPKAALALTVLVLAVVLGPVWYNWAQKPKDSFPLSYYPMFSHVRNGKANMTYLVGVDKDNRRSYLSYKMAGTGGMNQVRKVIRKRAETQPAELCYQVAQKVAKTPEYANIASIKIVKSEFELATFFMGNDTPSNTEVLCTCDVKKQNISLLKN